MADIERGPSLIRKYVWLLNTIYRAKRISFKEIKEWWLRDVEMLIDIDNHKETTFK